ncbi:DUF4421 family protein [Lacinutrix salivirga]
MRITILLFTLLCITAIHSQEPISFSDKLILKSNINSQSESLLVYDNNEESIIVDANNNYRVELAANYKFFGLKFGFSPSRRDSNINSKFKTIQLNLFINQWIQSFEYRKTQGFYQEEVTTIAAQFPNLKSTNWRGSTSYVLNQNFSLKHLLHLNAWQQRSSGSFVPSLDYGFNRLSNTTFGEKTIENNFDIALSPAYYYTWCFKEHWFASGSLSPTIGLRFSKDKSANQSNNNTYLTRGLDLSLQFGYTSNTISAGARFNFDSNATDKSKQISVVNDKSYASLYVGYRLNAPRFLRRSAEFIENKVGL